MLGRHALSLLVLSVFKRAVDTSVARKVKCMSVARKVMCISYIVCKIYYIKSIARKIMSRNCPLTVINKNLAAEVMYK